MKRRPGISGLQRGAQTKDVYKALGDTVNQTRLENIRAQMGAFKDRLEEFAMKHSNKGMWAQLMGFGDFYYELGVQVVEACLATRSVNGGLMDLDALRRYVMRRRGSRAEPVSEDDILRSIGKLKSLGSGFQVVKIGSQKLVRSVPGELNTDKSALLAMAQQTGYVSETHIKEALGWTETRREQTLQAMLKEELALIDDQDPSGGRLYWFPCLADFSGNAALAA